MRGMQPWRVIGTVAVLLAVGACNNSQPPTSAGERVRTRETVLTLTTLAGLKALFYDESPYSFPSGDIHSFYEWMADPATRDKIWDDIPAEWCDSDRQVFVDWRGNPLVYRFPSIRANAMFDLYSVGPNGIDEMGSGDDVMQGVVAEFRVWSDAFAGGVTDVRWILTNLGQLRRDASGRIIGAPPEKLKDVE